MTKGVNGRNKNILRIAALAAVAVSAGACSIMPDMPDVPDWVDPTTWFGSDTNTADNGQTPDLAGLPDKPQTTKPDDQASVAESLQSDRSHAEYSANTLRGGTEAAAPPPPNLPVAQATEETVKPVSAAQTGKPAAPAPVRTAQVDRSIARDPTGRSIPGALPDTAPSSQVAMLETPATPVETAPAQPSPPATPVASLPPPPPQPVLQTGMINPSDAALGFKPSAAPPLDPSLSQFVAEPIIRRYQQTATDAGLAYNATPVVMPISRHAAYTPRHKRHTAGGTQLASNSRSAEVSRPSVPRSHSEPAVGGPEHMSGAVVANLEALGPVVPNPAPGIYTDQLGNPASAVVFFPGDSVYLNATGRAQVREAAEQYKASGSQAYVRVVGHSSSRTPNMPVARHIDIIFSKSQERADAVARELIRYGVPASRVLVQAVGDSQPVYYESMPKGEEGNRRAEIFIQG